MHITKKDEDVLAGEEGEAKARLMEMLVALGEMYGAEELIPIRSAQVSGVSYKTIGEWGLRWLASLEDDCKVTVPTTLNPAGMDLEAWEDMGIPEEFALKQVEVIRAYEALGITCSCTCTPYHHVNIPGRGDHLAWAESSAVSYANSIIGARTNREGGPSALAAALIGKTPNYGLHLDEGRVPGIIFDITSPVSNFSALGYLLGGLAKGKVPYLRGIWPNAWQMKALCAAMAASGSVALYHIEDLTPEAAWAKGMMKGRDIEIENVSREQILQVMGELNTLRMKDGGTVGLIAVGCPQCSAEELGEVAGILATLRREKDREPDSGAKLWVCTSREAAGAARDAVATILEFGMVVNDTCMVVAPTDCMFRTTATNSAKAAHYMSKEAFGNQKVMFKSLETVLSMLWR